MVSVVITSYKREKLLNRAITSVLNQTYKNIQLIVIIDDPMADLSHYSQFNDRRLEVYKNSQNIGAQHSRNRGLELTKGKYYMNLDDDDYFHHKRVELLLYFYLGIKSSVSFVSSMSSKLSGGINGVMFRPKKIDLNRILTSNKVGNSIFTETVKVKEVGMWDSNLLAAQDYDLWIRLIKNYGPSYILNKRLIYIDDLHNSGRITNSENMLKGYNYCLKKHRYMMSDIQIQYANFRLSRLREDKYSFSDLLKSVPVEMLPYESIIFTKKRIEDISKKIIKNV